MASRAGDIARLIIAYAAPLTLLAIIAIRFVRLARKRRGARQPTVVTAESPRIRRDDRALSDARRIDSILASALVARIGLSVRDVPYVVPMNFGQADAVADTMTFDSERACFVARNSGPCRFYFHTAPDGRKLEMVRLNPTACFEAEGSVGLRKGARPCDWSMTYESVIGHGTLSIVTDESEKRRGLECIMRHAGERGELDFPGPMVEQTVVLRMDLLELTGKANPPAREDQ